MNRRSFASGLLLGGILMGIAFFAAAVALQTGGMPGLEEGEQAFAGESLAFVTSDPDSSPLEGRLMVHVDGQWRDVQFDVRMMPVD